MWYNEENNNNNAVDKAIFVERRRSAMKMSPVSLSGFLAGVRLSVSAFGAIPMILFLAACIYLAAEITITTARC